MGQSSRLPAAQLLEEPAQFVDVGSDYGGQSGVEARWIWFRGDISDDDAGALPGEPVYPALILWASSSSWVVFFLIVPKW